MNTGERIKALRLSRGLTQEKLGKILGVKKSAIAKYEHGKVENLKRVTIKKLADYFNVSPSYIIALEEDEKKSESNLIDSTMHFLKIPIYTASCCGDKELCDDNIIGYISIPTEMTKKGRDYFALKASGESMIGENINDGDVIVFEKTGYIENE